MTRLVVLTVTHRTIGGAVFRFTLPLAEADDLLHHRSSPVALRREFIEGFEWSMSPDGMA